MCVQPCARGYGACGAAYSAANLAKADGFATAQVDALFDVYAGAPGRLLAGLCKAALWASKWTARVANCWKMHDT